LGALGDFINSVDEQNLKYRNGCGSSTILAFCYLFFYHFIMINVIEIHAPSVYV